MTTNPPFWDDQSTCLGRPIYLFGTTNLPVSDYQSTVLDYQSTCLGRPIYLSRTTNQPFWITNLPVWAASTWCRYCWRRSACCLRSSSPLSPAAGTYWYLLEAGTYWYLLEAGSYWYLLEAGSYWYLLEAGTYRYLLEAGSYSYLLEAGSYWYLLEAGSYSYLLEAGTYCRLAGLSHVVPSQPVSPQPNLSDNNTGPLAVWTPWCGREERPKPISPYKENRSDVPVLHVS